MAVSTKGQKEASEASGEEGSQQIILSHDGDRLSGRTVFFWTPSLLSFNAARRPRVALQVYIVNGGEKSWRLAVEKCGALEWRIGC